jgi:hypothetical protein
MLSVVYDELPELYPFVCSCYSDQSFFRFGPFTLILEKESQRGDQLGSLLFCTTTRYRWSNVFMRSELATSGLDDGTLGSRADTLMTDFVMIITEAKKLGIMVSTFKCEFIADDDEVTRKFRSVVLMSGTSKFQLPDCLGLQSLEENGAWLIEVLIAKLQELYIVWRTEFLNLTRTMLFSAQKLFFVAEVCVGLQYAQYIVFQPLLAEYDEIIRLSLQWLQTIFNISFSVIIWNSATLPV